MKFFDDLRAERFLEEIRSSGDVQHPDAQKALQKLIRLGSASIPKILEVLPAANKQETQLYIDLMAKLVDAKSFCLFANTLPNAEVRTRSAIRTALTISQNYPPQLLLEELNREESPKSTILEIISAHKNRFGIRELLDQACKQKQANQALMFKIIGDIATEQSIFELLSRIDGKDPLTRTYIIDILSRFDRPEVAVALQTLLKDPNRQIRQSALTGLLRNTVPLEIKPICELLLDTDIEVQNKAVELIIRAQHPDTMRFLIPALKDENEYSRRAAVEVINALATAKDIKQLLQIIRDDDWWVRSRAGDALGKIGGPRVVEAVLQLIGDEDEEVRRAAIEILNHTRDERAIDFLIRATDDEDWWVAERAIDTLGEIGSHKAVPTLIKLANSTNTQVFPAVARALGKIKDPRAIDTLISLMNQGERASKIESIIALGNMTEAHYADTIISLIKNTVKSLDDAAIIQAAEHAIEEIHNRNFPGRPKKQAQPSNPAQPTKTLLLEKTDVNEIINHAERISDAQRLDINNLKTGDLIDGRYKFIEKIGKGAFGTVLLVQDSVVEEQLILKFLNNNVAQDEETMKRFVYELRYSRKVTHKNIIRIYDFLHMRGLYAISMEYFPSHPLNKEIINEKPMAITQAIRYGCEIANGMSSAHSAGIVHRDLKPANILVNESGELKVVDFGVAAAYKEGDTQLTKTGFVIGSPKYMAPEQIMGKKVDERADIYSLGIILYEMLTGVAPYSKGDHMAVMFQHVQGKAKPPIELNPTLPKALSDIVLKAMLVDKTMRIQSMDELRIALTTFL